MATHSAHPIPDTHNLLTDLNNLIIRANEEGIHMAVILNEGRMVHVRHNIKGKKIGSTAACKSFQKAFVNEFTNEIHAAA